MLDFPFDEPNIYTSLYCLIFYCILFVRTKQYGWNNSNAQITELRSGIILVIGFFFVTHCKNGDFFHFMQSVRNYAIGGYNYGEEIYQTIGFFVNKNYFLFRLIFWGAAFSAFLLTCRRMNLPKYQTAVILLVSFSIMFCYARATVAMAFYYLGVSYLLSPQKNKVISYALGIAFIWICQYFHTSALIMVVMTIMLFVPVRKWTIVLVLIVLPIAADLLKDYFFLFAQDEGTDEYMTRKLTSYSDRDREFGLVATIFNYINYASFYVPFLISTFCIYVKEKYVSINTSIIGLYKIAFGLIVISLSFLFFGKTFITFYYRILYMAMIPIILIVSYLYYNGFMTFKQFRWCLIPGIAYNILNYLYGVYLVSL